jgi:ribosome-associated protein
LAATKRPATKARAGTGSGGGAKKDATERPKLRSSHGARSYAAKKSHASATPARGPRASAAPRKTVRSASGTAKAPASSAKGPAGALPRTRKPRTAGQAALPATSLASDDAREVAVAIAIAALDKKAVGLEILDVAGKVDYADFLVLMTGRSDRQVAALAQGIEEALRKKNRRPLSVEGLPRASWVLMDFGDVVVHVFQDDARSLYDIEGLWLDARRIPVPIALPPN